MLFTAILGFVGGLYSALYYGTIPAPGDVFIAITAGALIDILIFLKRKL